MSDSRDDTPFAPPGAVSPTVEESAVDDAARGSVPTDVGGSARPGGGPSYAVPPGGYGSGGVGPTAGPPPGYGDGSGYSYGAGYGGYGSGYGYGPTGYQYAGYNPQPRTETTATLSLVFSLLAWPLCGMYGLGVVSAIAGIVLGFVARRKIRDADGMLTGDGVALAGIIVGAVNVAFLIAGIVLIVVAVVSSG